MRIVGILLTGGASTRMGAPKALLRLGADTFLARALHTLESAGIDDVVVVAGAHTTAIREAFAAMPLAPGVRLVENTNYEAGQLSSLLTGIDALAPHHPDAVIVALIDHPRVQPTTVVALVNAFLQHRPPVVRPVYEGRHGHPVLLARETFDALRATPLDQGARAVVRALGDRVLDLPVDDPGVCEDVDTREDYEGLRGRSG